MGHTTNVTGMLVGIPWGMPCLSFRMGMHRRTGFHVRMDTERFVVMMMGKNTYDQHPQADKQQAICIYTMSHIPFLMVAKVKRNPEKNNVLHID